MNSTLFAPHIGEIFSDAATELTQAAREFLVAELPQLPASDALLVGFFTQSPKLIVAVFERTSVTRAPLVNQTSTHFREGSAPKMLSGVIATILLAMAQKGVTRPDELTRGEVMRAMKRVAA